ncbi:ricin B lectin domain-containing protein [Rhizoctonia solani]|nr:ricin B lectin domain-containing protein [Rhizoctonia solani]
MQAYAVYAMQLAEPGLQLFRAAMGQGVGHLPVDETVEPGTYHIANGLTGTVLQVSGHDLTKIVSWKLEKDVEKLEQQWCLQRSGTGYRFKNRKYNDLYLSVASTDTHAFVTASKCPSTWVLLKIGDHYGIKLAEHDKMIDLHFGRRANGTEIHIWPSDGSTKQTWNLVRIK